jgi:hypothetical protein
MSRHPPPPETPVTLPHIWPGLPGDLQQRAVRLLAQLAYAQFRQHAQLTTKEIGHGHCTLQSQDSPRPS